jgi:hypothetical protein
MNGGGREFTDLYRRHGDRAGHSSSLTLKRAYRVVTGLRLFCRAVRTEIQAVGGRRPSTRALVAALHLGCPASTPEHSYLEWNGCLIDEELSR